MENSDIGWTDHTFNLWEGCTKVSEACRNCYAEHICDTRFGRVNWGPKGERRLVRSTLREPYRWHRRAVETGERPRVFCMSLGDFFDDHTSIDPRWREYGWQVMRDTPCLQWLVLSKRPENFARFLPDDWGEGFPNVCLMVTVENQECAQRRIPLLVETPAKWRGLSVEPLLERVDLSPWIDQLDWVIVGGETLGDARPMNPNWVREIRDLCAEHGVPFFFKQWGWWTPEVLVGDHLRCTFPDDETVFLRRDATRNGNLLDGREHVDHPFSLKLTQKEMVLGRGLLARASRRARFED